MADFSAHGNPSPEWVKLTTNPDGSQQATGFASQGFLDLTGLDVIAEKDPRDPELIAKVEKLQAMTDAAREVESAKWWDETGLKHRLTVKDIDVPSRDGQIVPSRFYVPKDDSGKKYPVYIFFHGGGFVFGSVTGEDVTCSDLADKAQIMVFNVCYRHTPAVRHPTPFNDAADALDWVHKNIAEWGGDPDSIVVGGISAGGGLAAALTLAENKATPGAGRIKGQLLGAPWLLHPSLVPYPLLASKEIASYNQCRDAPVLPESSMKFFAALLDEKNPRDEYIQVPAVEELYFKGMPKTAFLVAGMDPLRDEALLYAEKLEKDRKVPVRTSIFPGLPHGFRRFKSLPATAKWDEAHIDALKWFLEKN